MNRTLSVKHTADRHHNPLACRRVRPGAGLACAKNATYDPQAEPQNPFVVYRAEICGHYSTAQRLTALTLHLYNGHRHGVRLDNLLSSADERHTRIALEMLAWYAKHGENCPEFMSLARELVERDHSTTDDE